MQCSCDIDTTVSQNVFSEPRLVLIQSDVNEGDIIQGFIVAEKTLVFEITEFSVVDGLIALLASYYIFHVNYAKSTPALSLMLFLQEQVMGMPD